MMALKDSIKNQAVSLYGSTSSNEIIIETNKALADSIKENVQAQRAARTATATATAAQRRQLLHLVARGRGIPHIQKQRTEEQLKTTRTGRTIKRNPKHDT